MLPERNRGRNSPAFSGIAGCRSGGHPMGLVHVNGNGFMDGIVLVRKIRIIFIIRIKEFQLSAKTGTFQDPVSPRCRKRSMPSACKCREGQGRGSGKTNGKKQFFLLLSRIVCTGGKLRLSCPAALMLSKSCRIGQHGKNGEHTENIVRIMKKKDLQQPVIPFRR